LYEVTYTKEDDMAKKDSTAGTVEVYRNGKMQRVSEAEADAMVAANRRRHAGREATRVIEVNDDVRVGGIGRIGSISGNGHAIIVRGGK
jgi:hypothetical protein